MESMKEANRSHEHFLSPTTATTDSWIGGTSCAPPRLAYPMCMECARPLTMFLHVHAPESPKGPAETVEIFACVQCGRDFPDEPDPSGARQGIDVSEDYLRRYQTHFRVLAFSESTPQPPRLAESPRVVRTFLTRTTSPQDAIGSLWIPRRGEKRRRPGSLAGQRCALLLDFDGLAYPPEPGAPPQAPPLPTFSMDRWPAPEAGDPYLIFGSLRILVYVPIPRNGLLYLTVAENLAEAKERMFK